MRTWTVLTLAGTLLFGAAQAQGSGKLAEVQERGELICGVNDQLPGFGSVDDSGTFTGFDTDFCRAIAAAVLGDAEAVRFRPLSAQERFTAVQTGEVDVLIRNTTWTSSRDTDVGLDFAPVNFFDGQGFMVRGDAGIETLEDLEGLRIGVQSGTTTELNLADVLGALDVQYEPVVFELADQLVRAYDQGAVDAWTTDKSGLASYLPTLQDPSAHVIMDATISKEPLAPAVLQGDSQWKDVVSWVLYALFSAEEYGITADNAAEQAETSQIPDVQRLLGTEPEPVQQLGLEPTAMLSAIQAVGNYGEIYDRNLGPDTQFNIPRGLNALWGDGGLLYGMPFR
jgi:general L-amino acid transport system substrate-binding protein